MSFLISMRIAPQRVLLCGAVAIVLQLAACGGGGSGTSADAPGVLSISASPQLSPYPVTTEQLNAVYDAANDMAYAAGARGQMVTFTWNALETAPGVYDPARINELRAALDTAQTRALTHFIGLQAINAGNKEVPADLRALAFDHPQVRARFHALLDRVVGGYKGSIQYLSLGNEVDIYLGNHPDAVAPYTNFFRDAASYARSIDPAVRVGVTIRAEAAVGSQGALLQSLNDAGSDVAMLTYYPLQTDSAGVVTVRAPSVVADDMTRLLAFAGNRPLVFQEAGYPASSVNGSNEALQAEFIHELFKAWQGAGQRVPFLNVFLLHDFTQQTCDNLVAYYGVAAPSFEAYLCSLGLRKVDGTPRQAWQALLDESSRLKFP